MGVMFGNVVIDLFLFSGDEIIFKVYFLFYVHECFICMHGYAPHMCSIKACWVPLNWCCYEVLFRPW